jgi:hypothetical protein
MNLRARERKTSKKPAGNRSARITRANKKTSCGADPG